MAAKRLRGMNNQRIDNPEQHAIVFFDGECNVCSQSVQFIIKHDKHGYFLFASLQAQIAQSLLAQKGMDAGKTDSIVLMEDNQCFIESSAVLRICKRLDGLWKGLYVFKVIPKLLRDPAYRWFARNRYRLFGKKQSCMVPDANIKQRFLD
jgi:predicted DCC family thiol-disulfide oxidoreductase YuxK